MTKWELFKKTATLLLNKFFAGTPPDLYVQRLVFELLEIEKQGAEQYWLGLVAEAPVFPTNPNRLILPWLFGMVADDPIVGHESAIFTSTRFIDVSKYLNDHHGLPAGFVLDVDKPDIDIDCLPCARDAIKEYAAKTYGTDVNDGYGVVCSVGTWMTYQFKSALNDVAVATGRAGLRDIQAMTKELPDDVDDIETGGIGRCKGTVVVDGMPVDCKTKHMSTTCPKCGSTETDHLTIGRAMADFEGLRAIDQRFPKLITEALQLVGRISKVGKHAGALVIADRPLFGNIPMEWDNEAQQWKSIWAEGNNPQLSKFGYTKWDFLGLKNLQFIYDCCALITRNYGITFGANLSGLQDSDPDDDRLGYYWDRDGTRYRIDLNDLGALGVADQANTDAIFQFDTDLAKRTLGNGVRSFNDLMVLMAMGHPGPMQCCWSHTSVMTDCGDIDIKDIDHTKHAIAYLARAGEKYTRNYRLYPSGKKKLLKITLSNGRVLMVTPEHPILTSVNVLLADYASNDILATTTDYTDAGNLKVGSTVVAIVE